MDDDAKTPRDRPPLRDDAETMRLTRRAASIADRDVLVVKHETWESTDGDHMTPPPQSEPDEIEDAATRITRRKESIQARPGPTPAPEAITAAITIHGFKTELEGVKSVVRDHGIQISGLSGKVDGVSRQLTELVPVLLGELVKDRDVARGEEANRAGEDHLRAVKTIDTDHKREVTTIDLEHKRETSAIEVAAAVKKAKWDLVTKGVAIVSTLAAAAMGLIEAAKC